MPVILHKAAEKIQAKGHSESSAWAIATAAMQKAGNLKPGTATATKQGKLRGKKSSAWRQAHPPHAADALLDQEGQMWTRDVLLDDVALLDDVRRTSDGYMVCEALVARVGTQRYRGREVGLRDRDFVTLYRPPEEVFSASAMHSMANKPITLTHPSRMVDTKTWAKVAKGFSGSDVVRDGEYVRVPLMLTDAAAIEAYENGVRELSVGYTTDIDWTPGQTPDGEAYDGVQRDIRANHHALVPVARGGRSLRFGDGVTKSPCPNCGAMMDANECPSCGYRERPTQGGDADIDDAWSEEARAAALEARKRTWAAREKEAKASPDTSEGYLARRGWRKPGQEPEREPDSYEGPLGPRGWRKPTEAQRWQPKSKQTRDADLEAYFAKYPEAAVYDRDVSEEERKSLAKQGKALPHGGFPIKNKADLANAKQAIGRAKNPAAARALINRRARELGEPGLGETGDADGGVEGAENMVTVMIRGLPVQVSDGASASILEQFVADQAENFGGKKATPFKKKNGNGGDDNDDDEDDTDARDQDAVAAEQAREKKERGYRDSIAARDGEIALLKKKLRDSEFSEERQEQILRDRDTVKAQARKVLGDSYEFGTQSLKEIRRAVAAAAMGGEKLIDGWDDAQVLGAFNLAVAGPAQAQASGVRRMADGMSDGVRRSAGFYQSGVQMTDKDIAYDEYCKRIQDDYKTPMADRRN
jgi:hypothetical protein